MGAFKRIFLPFALLTLFVVYQANIVMNTHVHYINGIAFTHSHPNNGEHSHSNADLSLYNRLSVYHSLKVGGSTYNVFQQVVLYTIKPKQDITRATEPHWNNWGLRAPPACA